MSQMVSETGLAGSSWSLSGEVDIESEVCQKLIRLSFAKIVSSKNERGGAKLHRNLLILHLLQKARNGHAPSSPPPVRSSSSCGFTAGSDDNEATSFPDDSDSSAQLDSVEICVEDSKIDGLDEPSSAVDAQTLVPDIQGHDSGTQDDDSSSSSSSSSDDEAEEKLKKRKHRKRKPSVNQLHWMSAGKKKCRCDHEGNKLRGLISVFSSGLNVAGQKGAEEQTDQMVPRSFSCPSLICVGPLICK